MLLTYNGGIIDAADEFSARLLANGWQRVDSTDEQPDEDLSALTVAQLKELCSERGIDVPSRVTKAQLIAFLTA